MLSFKPTCRHFVIQQAQNPKDAMVLQSMECSDGSTKWAINFQVDSRTQYFDSFEDAMAAVAENVTRLVAAEAAERAKAEEAQRGAFAELQKGGE